MIAEVKDVRPIDGDLIAKLTNAYDRTAERLMRYGRVPKAPSQALESPGKAVMDLTPVEPQDVQAPPLPSP